MTKIIVISGGPGSGKTTIVSQLVKRGYSCFDEVSREIIIAAQKEGVEQLFLTDPEEFSRRILKGRIDQYIKAKKEEVSMVFIDRGIPDIVAYMDFKNEASPEHFREACKACRYDFVFLLPPWKQIYKQDSERYETFEEAEVIYDNLKKTYSDLDYETIEVPFGNLSERVNHILNIVEFS
ncbi:MAG: ATP-binding protein [Flavobacteriaceae bacterium]|nr:ATP-binding protein [Flavobacteriaceae bacterium]